MTTEDKITQILRESLEPVHLEIRDESNQHAGHQEARTSGGGHFQLTIVSSKFQSLKLIDRHRLVYQALKPVQGDIHALTMKAMTPEEWKT